LGVRVGMDFLVIPAVDIKNGKAVRLSQGQMEKETVYSEDPLSMAKLWESKAAQRLHIVDLDAALKGSSFNKELIKKMAKELKIPVQVGGGIRDKAIAKEYLEAGIDYIILGTVAFESKEVFESIVEEFPNRVILSIDARNGVVSVRGWTKDLSLHVLEVVKEYSQYPIAYFIYTDILKDGMNTGPNFKATRELLETSPVPVILAGGIRDIFHIKEAMKLMPYGLAGVITGRAIYEKTLDLEEAIGLVKGEKDVGGKDK